MSVADNDAGAKDGEAGKTDVAHGVFLHAHYTDIAKLAAGWAIPASWQPRAKAPTTAGEVMYRFYAR